MCTPRTWVNELAEKTTNIIHLIDEDSPLGCHYYVGEEFHEITLFFSSTEVVGGPNDGSRIATRFAVDVLELMQLFDFVDTLTWQPHRIDSDDDLGANLSITGVYQSHQVWIRILGEAPECFMPGRVTNHEQDETVNLWEE